MTKQENQAQWQYTHDCADDSQEMLASIESHAASGWRLHSVVNAIDNGWNLVLIFERPVTRG